MNASDFASALDSLRDHEGLRLTPYQDTRGFWTIGYGIKLPLTRAECEFLLEHRAVERLGALSNALRPWFEGLDGVRQGVLLEMSYQLGVGGVLGFPKFLAFARQGQHDKAAAELLDSVWAREQTPPRARELAQRWKTGQVK